MPSNGDDERLIENSNLRGNLREGLMNKGGVNSTDATPKPDVTIVGYGPQAEPSPAPTTTHTPNESTSPVSAAKPTDA